MNRVRSRVITALLWAEIVCLVFWATTIRGRVQADDGPSGKRSMATFVGTKAGQVRDDNAVKLKIVWCPPGTFTMADSIYNPDKINEPIKLAPVIVTLSKGYWIGQFEVTRSEWKQVMKTGPWRDRFNAREGARLPADYITWNDAMDFCRKLTQQERQAGRLSVAWEYALPTEAQWERACRAGTQTRFSFGDDGSKLGEYAWYYDNSSKLRLQLLHPVGKKKANPWGIYDMYGNVLEWCRDLYAEKPPGGRDPEVKPQVKLEAPADSHRVIRGGWSVSSAAQCESGYRTGGSPGYRDGNFGGRGGNNVGFRVALIPSGQ
jgi:formylglycine-generating enzyme required for sulfatase activity